MELTDFVAVRMDKRTLQLLDRVAERLTASCPPGITATRSHAIRHLITSSAGAAVLAGSTLPDPEKPMRSG